MKLSTAFIIVCLFVSQLKAQGDQNDFLMGRSLMLVGSSQTAIDHFTSHLKSRPGDIDALFQRGICYFNIREYENAINDFLQVNRRRKAMASLMLAKTEVKLGHYTIAANHLRDHLNSPYKKAEKDLLLDEVLLEMEQSDAWKKLWKEKEWYNSFDRDLQEAMFLKNSGDYPSALNMFYLLDKKGFKKSIVNQHIAEILNLSGNQKDALDALEISIKSNPGNQVALKSRIAIQLHRENFDQAYADCKQLLRYYPDEFDYYLVLAKLENMNRLYEQAVKTCKLYMLYFPDSAKVYNTLGEVHFDNGKYLDALPVFSKALELDSGNPLIYYNRGHTYYKTKTYSFAKKDISMSLDLDPKSADTWILKGQVEEKMGNLDSACYAYKQAWKLGSYPALENFRRICE